MTAPRRGDSGFTLVELLISVVMIGVITPAVGNVMVVYFRTAHSASVRTDRAHDANLFAAYLQPDLASATTVAPASGCGSTLQLTWTETQPLPNGTSAPVKSFSAAYAVVAAAGDAGPFIVRRTSVSDGATTTQVVMHDLESAGAVTFCSNGATPSLVTVRATAGDESTLAEAAPLDLSGAVGGRV